MNKCLNYWIHLASLPLIPLLLLLLLKIIHGNWLLAHGARVILFEPVLNAGRVEEVSVVARQLDCLVVGLVLHHTNNALRHAILIAGLVLAPHDILQNILVGRHPLPVWAPRSPVLSKDHGSEADYQRSIRAAFYDCHVSEDYQ